MSRRRRLTLLFNFSFLLFSLGYKVVYPCRCLCLGFLQITATRPLLRTILQSRHIFLTDALTFIESMLNLNANYAKSRLTQRSIKLCKRILREFSQHSHSYFVSAKLFAVNNTTTSRILVGHFYYNPVAWHNSYKIYAHFTGKMRQNMCSIIQ